jgi:division protein CdvB (Snf7/Vps24/ESCRT-III family)
MSFLKRSSSLKDKLQNAFINLKNYYNKINLIKYKLNQREKELFEKVVKAKQYNKNDIAAIIANEIAEIRKLQKNLEGISLSIEQLMLRIETIMHMEEFTGAVAATKSLIQSIREKVSNLSPELGIALDELSNGLEGLNLTYPEENIVNTSLSDDAESILKEAAKEASKAEAIELPEIPLYQDKRPVRVMEAEGYGRVQDIPVAQKVSMPVKDEMLSKEEKVLRYIIENKGKIDLNKCSLDLGISTFEIQSILTSLSKQGKIEILRK